MIARKKSQFVKVGLSTILLLFVMTLGGVLFQPDQTDIVHHPEEHSPAPILGSSLVFADGDGPAICESDEPDVFGSVVPGIEDEGVSRTWTLDAGGDEGTDIVVADPTKVITGLCIKAGPDHSTIIGNGFWVWDSGDLIPATAVNGCYFVVGIGTRSVTVTQNIQTSSCRGLSHADLIVGDGVVNGALIVIKVVINDDGGTKTVEDFSFVVNDGSATTFDVSGTNVVTVTPGTYSVTEPAVSGYTTTLSNCTDVEIAAGEAKTCTIINNDQPANLIVIKNVTNDHGGTKSPSDFTMNVSGTDVSSSSFAGSSGGTTVTLDAGSYEVTENADSAYDATFANCSGSIANGETKTCIVTNNDKPANLIVIKNVTNDHGGTKSPSDFTMNVSGTDVSSSSFAGSSGGTTVTLDAGSYEVTENADSAYDATFANCSGSIANGETKTCTVTNNDKPANLIVIKNVTNDHGGTKSPSDFTMNVSGTDVSSSSFAGSSGGTTVTLDAGSYEVTENADSAYDATFANCSGSIANGETKTCTVTNNDKPANLIVIKNVTNDHGGTKSPSDFTMNVSGTDVSSSSFAGSSGGTTVTLDAGSYEVTENADSAYDATFANCSGSIANGETKTCTVTNNDKPATLIVIKNVTNDHGGAKSPSDFTMNVSGTDVSSSSFAGSSGGTTVTLDAGSYEVTENADSAYDSAFANCSGSIANGETKTCTVTNNDKPANLIVIKNVTNDHGGTKSPSDFTMNVSGTDVSSSSFAGSSGGTTVTLDAGSYEVTENADSAYDATFANCSGSIANGETKTCTVTNNDKPATLIVIKNVTNDHGGTKSPSDFTMNVSGTDVSSSSFAGSSGGTTVTLDAGSYEVTENADSAYDATFANCSGSIANGETKTCTVTNNDKPATLIVIKNVVNNNGGTKSASDFTINVNGTDVSSSSFPGAASPGTTVTLDAGSYEVTENADSGYNASFSTDCSGSIGNGETKTCTVTNDDISGSLRIVKNTVGGDGTFTINTSLSAPNNSINITTSGGTNSVTISDVVAGTYTISETVPSGWDLTGNSCGGSVTVVNGQESVCTFTNDIKPDISISKTNDANGDNNFTDNEQVAAPGDNVTFRLTITNNTSESVTINSISDNIHSVAGSTCAFLIGQTLAANAMLTCSFNGPSPSDDNAIEIDTVTVIVEDDENNELTRTDTSTVTTPDILPSITVVKDNDANGDNSFNDTEAASAGGVTVPFRVTITNNTSEALTLTSISDNIHTTDVNDCSSTTIPANGSITCNFSGTIVNDDDASEINTVTANASDDDGNNTSGSDTSTVTTPDILPSITVVKDNDANGDNSFNDSEAASAGGVTVPFRVTITNNTNEDLTLTSISDNIHTTDVNDCSSTTIPANGSITCNFSGTIVNDDDVTEVNTVTVNASDDDDNNTSGSDTSTVTTPDILPSITVVKDNDANGDNSFNDSEAASAGGVTVPFRVTITNNTNEDLTLTSISDNIHTTDVNDCSSTTIPANGSITCNFSGTIVNDDDATEVNTVTVNASDDDGNNTSGSDTSTVTTPDILPSITVVKDNDANGDNSFNDTEQASAGGVTVPFRVTITNNTDEDLTLTSISDNIHTTDVNDCSSTTIPANGSITCNFSGTIVNDDDASEVNTVTVNASDDDDNNTSGSDTSTVTTPDILPSITVVKDNDANGDNSFNDTEVASAGGVTVPFRVTITNNTDEDLTLTSISDNIHTTDVNDCSSTTIPANGSITCNFSGTIVNDDDATEVNTVTVNASDDDDNNTSGSDTSTVTTPDILPSITVVKDNDANGDNSFNDTEAASAGGATVPFRVTITNNTDEDLTLTSISDNIHTTDVNDCSSTTIPANGSITCNFSGTIVNDDDATEVNTVTVNASDDDDNNTSGSDTSTVTTPDILPSITVVKDNDANGDNSFNDTEAASAGGATVPFRVTITNNTDEDLTLTSISDNIHTTDVNDCSSTAIPANGSITCNFSGTIVNDDDASEVNTVTVNASDDDDNNTSGSDTSTVTTPDILPDITVSKDNDANGDNTFSDTEEAPNGGATVPFRVTITNNTDEDLTLTSISDNIHTTDVNDCSSTTIPANGSITCNFSGPAPLGDNETETDTITVQVSDDDSNNLTRTDTSTVTTPDITPDITVVKDNDANGDNSFNDTETASAGGITVPFRVTITNNNNEVLTLDSISDNIHTTDVNDCSSTTIPANGSITCNFSGTIINDDDASEINTVTVQVSDGDGNTASGSDTSTVITPDILPNITVVKDNDADGDNSFNDTEAASAGGVTVPFRVTITNNTNEDLALDSISDDIHSTDVNDCSSTTIPANGSITCNFSGTIVNDDDASEVNTVTVNASDDDDNNTSGSDTSTVTTPDILPSITVVKNNDANGDNSFNDTEAASAGGVTVPFLVTITNNTNEDLTLTSISDNIHTTDVNDCSSTTIPANGSITCNFSGTIVNDDDATEINTVTVNASDDDDNNTSGSDTSTVTTPDILPSITVVKDNDANGDNSFNDSEAASAGGVTVPFRVTITNNTNENLTLTSISDNIHATSVSDCSSTMIVANGSITCNFTGTITIDDDASEVNTVTVNASDDDDNNTSGSDTSTVTTPDILPDISVTKSNDANGDNSFNDTEQASAGGVTVPFRVTITNNTDEDLTLTSISDNIHTTDVNDCSSTTIPANGSVTCNFSGTIVNDDDASEVNTVTVNASDDDDNNTSGSDTSTVTTPDILPSITVVKDNDANGDNSFNDTEAASAGGVTVPFRVTITNNTNEVLTLDSISDNIHTTDVNDCSSTTIPANGSITCNFSGTIVNDDDASEINTVTVNASDDDDNNTSGSDTSTVVTPDILPSITVVKDNDANGDNSFNDTETASAGGISVPFRVTITNNTDEELTLDSISDNIHDTDVNDCSATTISANGSITCSFSGTIINDDNASEINTITVNASDDDDNNTSGSDTSTVNTPDITPSITVAKDNDANGDNTFSDTEAASAGGVSVPFRVTITNNTNEALTLTSIDDDIHTTDVNDCSSTNIPANGSITCNFSGTIINDDNASEIDTITVQVQDDDDNNASGSDTSTVTTPDITPNITVSKTNDANGDNSFNDTEAASAGGVSVPFRVTITNNTDEDLTLNSIDDDIHTTDVNDCSSTTIPASGSITCNFSGTIINDDNASETDTITVNVSDDDGNNTSGSDTSTVTTPDITPDITVQKDNDANGDNSFNDTETASAGGVSVPFRVTITNNTNEDLTLTSISDNIHTTGLSDCSSTNIPANGSITCNFNGNIVNDDAASEIDTITVNVSDDDDNSTSGTDTSTVNTPDITPDITVVKSNDANGDNSFNDTEQALAGGVSVPFRVTITNNTDEDLTLDSISDDIHVVTTGNCSSTTILANGSITCNFSGTIVNEDDASETDTITVNVSDDDDNSTSGSDTSTVTTPDITPDITVSKDNDANGDNSFSDTETASAGGVSVPFRVTITNNTDEDLTLTSISDNIHTTDVNDCSSTTILANDSITCNFSGTIINDDNASEIDTITVNVRDDDENTAQGTDTSTVITPDITPDITVSKDNDANGDNSFNDFEQASAGGVSVPFRVTITNNTDENLTLTSISDNIHTTDVNDCSSSTILANGSITCNFSGTIVNDDDASETDTITVQVRDDDENTAQGTDTSTVTTPDITPNITVVKSNDANGDNSFSDTETASAGGVSVPFRVTITNNTNEDLTLTSISDNVHTTGLSDCSSTTILANDSITCNFSGTIINDDNASEIDTITVNVRDDDENTAQGTDTSTVNTPDITPDITVSKDNDANGDNSFNDSEQASAGGVSVPFRVTITNNTNEDLTLTSISDNIHTTDVNDCSSSTILANGSITCNFSGNIVNDDDASEVDTITVNVRDDDDNSTSGTDTSTVTTPDITPDITVSKVNDADGDNSFSDEETALSLGATVPFRVVITNNTDEDLTLNSISDDIHTTDVNDCSSTTILANSSITCNFSGPAPSTSNTDEIDTITVQVSDDDDNSLTETDTSKVTTPNTLPSITVQKDNDANGDTTFSDTEEAPNAGASVTFKVTITNTTSEAVTIVSIDDDIHSITGSSCDSLQGQSLAGNSSTSCTFTGTIVNDDNASETDTVTVVVRDGDGDEDTKTDTSTVTTPDVTPDITVSKDNDANGDNSFNDTETASAGGVNVPFRVTITNNTSEDLTLTSISDDIHNTDVNDCSSTTIPANSFITCNFSGTIINDDDASEEDTITVNVRDDDENSTSGTDTSTVNTPDITPDITVVKSNDANGDNSFNDTETASAGGVSVPFRVTITNNTSEDLTLTSISDDIHNTDVNDCSSTTIPANSFITCNFSGTIINDDDASEEDTITVNVRDDDENSTSGTDTSTVNTPDITPDITVVKSNDANGDNSFNDTETASAGGVSVPFRVTITNNTDEDLTLDSISDDIHSTDVNDCSSTTILANSFITCNFSGTIISDDNASEEDTITVQVSDDDDNSTSGTDTSTVNTPDITPDITVVKSNDANGDNSFNDTETASAGGVNVPFRVTITNNTDEDLTLDSISDDIHSTDVNDCSSTTILANSFITCNFSGTIISDDNASEEDTITVQVSDDDDNSTSGTDTSTVNTPDITPDITVTKSNDANGDNSFNDTETASAGGVSVPFRVTITNNTDEELTLDSISDDIHETDVNDCTSTTIAANGSITCNFSGTIISDDNASEEDTITVQVSDDDSNTTSGTDTSTVNTPDITPDITVTKSNDANGDNSFNDTETASAGGVDVPFRVTITNNTDEELTLDSISDNIHSTDVNDCSSTTIAANGSITCNFSGTIISDDNASEEDTITVQVSDDDSNTTSGTDTSTVNTPDITPDITVTKSNDANGDNSFNDTETASAGGVDVPFRVTITNNTDEDLTLDSISDDIHSTDVNDCSSTTIAANGSITCNFSGTIISDDNASEEDTITVQVSDDDDNSTSGTDTSIVNTPDIEPDITVSKDNDANGDNTFSDIETASGPGVDVPFRVTITNNTDEELALDSISDDIHETDVNDCTSTTIPANGSVTCNFTGTITNDDDASEMDTITVNVSDNDENTTSGTDTSTVNTPDITPDITVSKDNDADGDNSFSDTEEATSDTVDFQVTITNNTDEELTLDSISDDVHTTDVDDCSSTTIPANGSIICTFTGPTPSGDNASERDTITVQVSDDDDNSTSETDTSTVTTPDILPDITVVKENNANGDNTFSNTESASAGGVDVPFRVTITNNTDEALTLDSISDDIHTTDVNDCSAPTIPANGSITCNFTGTITSDDNATETNTVTVEVSDDDDNTASETDTSVVTTPDILPEIIVSKDNNANGDSTFSDTETASGPNANVPFRVTITNPTDEDLTLDSISDDIHVVTTGNCSSTTIPANGSITCNFSGRIINDDDSSETDIITVNVSDDDGNSTETTDTSTVEVPDVLPQITVTKTANITTPNPGITVTYTVLIENNTSEAVDIVSVFDDIEGVIPVSQCTLGTIAPNGSSVCTFIGTAPDTFSTNLTNIVTVRVEDDDGNSADASADETVRTPFDPALICQLDQTPPNVQIDSPADGAVFDLNEFVLANWNVSDANGIATVTFTTQVGQPIDTTNPGGNSFFVTAVDTCGNETTVIHTYDVRFLALFAGGGGAVEEPTLDVVINEVAWFGTSADASDEWIELKNNSTTPVSLDGWTLTVIDNINDTITIIELNGILLPNGFFLLERGDNDTVSNIPADLLFSEALPDFQGTLILRDPEGNLIDTANRDLGIWPAGTTRNGAPPVATMERNNPIARDTDENWQSNDGVNRNGLDADGNTINGTPKRENSLSAIFAQVVINEVAWFGTAASENDEWIELRNISNEPINFNNWTLTVTDDEDNIVSIIELNGFIDPDGFYLLERDDNDTVADVPADLIFNEALPDSGGKLVLRDAEGRLVDTANRDLDIWPAGSGATGNPPYATMERLDPIARDLDLNWLTNDGQNINGLDADGNRINGTPKATNSVRLTNLLRFQLTDVDGNLVTNATPTLSIVRVTIENGRETLTEVQDALPFIFNQNTGEYVFDLDTTTLEPGLYELFVDFGDETQQLIARIRVSS